jgi:hypothetical protein
MFKTNSLAARGVVGQSGCAAEAVAAPRPMVKAIAERRCLIMFYSEVSTSL